MGGDFEQRASRRGAAGGDVRMSDVPQEYVEACLERLSEECVEGEPKTPLLRILERAIRRDQLVLPMVSTTLTRVLGLLERPDVAITDLALAVETDPALATKIVGVANSAAYAGIDSASSVHDALMRVGLEQAKTIIAGVAFRSSVFHMPGFEREMDMLWQRSLANALATLALLEHDPRWRDSAFLLGLVQDVGRIVLLATVAAATAKKTKTPSAAAIEAAGDVIRCELGAIALSAWAFDDDLVDAVVWQEQPEKCPEASRPLAKGLYAADTLIHLGMRGWQPGANADSDMMVGELVEPLGFELQQMAEVLALVEGGMSAFSKLG